jgi:stage II sporulation protein D
MVLAVMVLVASIFTASAPIRALPATSPVAETQSAGCPNIRVLLEQGTHQHRITCDAGRFQVRWGDDVATVHSPLAVVAAKGSLRVGDRVFTESVKIRAVSGDMQIGERHHEGWVEWTPEAGAGGWQMIEQIPLERYLLGVVSREMSASSFPPAALEAQAIAARTYANFQIQARGPGRRYHLRGDTRSQAYGGTARIPQAIKDAVQGTRGFHLLTAGRIFESFYHSTCGGQTCSAAQGFGIAGIPTMPSVACDGCVDSRFFRWRQPVPEMQLRQALEDVCTGSGIQLGKVSAVTPIETTASGHVPYLRIDHGGGSFEIDTSRLRSALGKRGNRGLRSASFTVRRTSEGYLFDGKGWGHGIGMCQVGAQGYARRGANRIWILEHYYPGAKAVRLW